MMGEAGIAGLLTGLLLCGSIISLRTSRHPRPQQCCRCDDGSCHLVFWPIASSADFFGQWNNLFMRALAVALAGA